MNQDLGDPATAAANLVNLLFQAYDLPTQGGNQVFAGLYAWCRGKHARKQPLHRAQGQPDFEIRYTDRLQEAP